MRLSGVEYTHSMSKRLQVLLPDEEMDSVRRLAKAENLSVGEYVRRALREDELRRPSRSASAKLASIREATRHSFPTGSVEEMNREIAEGYAQ